MPRQTFPTLNDIRESCNFVTRHAQHVSLNPTALCDFAKTITTPPAHWLTTNPHQLLSLPLPLLTTILLFFEAIDYSFWPDPTLTSIESSTTKLPCNTTTKSTLLTQKWTVPSPSGPLDGSLALLYLFVSAATTSLPDFSTFSDSDFHRFFHPAGTVGKIPLLSERSETLRETAAILRTRLNNNFYTSVQNFTTDEQLFYFLIRTFPSLRDQRTYRHRPIHFYKLAQLLTSDLLFVRHHLEHAKVDTSHLPGCADYKIPQALRAIGLITYDDALSKLVDSRCLLPEGSPEEIEIRAATVSAIDFLHRELPHLTPIQINDYLFLASRNLSNQQPYHLTRNTNY